LESYPDTGGQRGRRNGGALVPLHSLYGEESGATVDSIHVEPLRDRSELFQWSIDAHTHAGLHQVVLLLNGNVEVTLDDTTRDIAAPAVIAIPASTVHSFEYQPDSSGFMLTIADGHLDGASLGAWLRSRLFENSAILSLSEGDLPAERLHLLAAEVAREQQGNQAARGATMDWLTRTLLVLIARESDRFRKFLPDYQGSDLFRDFRGVVEAHYTDHWSVGRYAKHLHVSVSSLNRLCRTVAGITAFEVANGRLEIEARRRLTYATVPIHRIAGDLGFADPSYFARFFRRRTGMSPREFRAQNQPAATSQQ
jgi:AraC family transcriptional activator of pobA